MMIGANGREAVTGGMAMGSWPTSQLVDHKTTHRLGQNGRMIFL